MKEQPVTRRPDRCPTHPGEVLREDVLPSLGVSVAAFARAIGVSRQTVHAILRGDKGVTPAMALRIGKFVGNGPGLWLRMQQTHDLWLAERDLAQMRIPAMADTGSGDGGHHRSVATQAG